jgi:hypothetical protein
MRQYPFVYAPFLIALTLLLNNYVPLLKSPPPRAQTFAAVATHLLPVR